MGVAIVTKFVMSYCHIHKLTPAQGEAKQCYRCGQHDHKHAQCPTKVANAITVVNKDTLRECAINVNNKHLEMHQQDSLLDSLSEL